MDSDALQFCAGLMGRDTMEESPTYGQTANAAIVAYWVSPEDHTLNRYESYDLSNRDKGRGWEFALNVLDFGVECMDPWLETPDFKSADWNSLDEVKTDVRRGLPMAIRVKVHLTDERHLAMYYFDSQSEEMRLKDDFTEEDDPMAQTFVQIVPILTNH